MLGKIRLSRAAWLFLNVALSVGIVAGTCATTAYASGSVAGQLDDVSSGAAGMLVFATIPGAEGAESSDSVAGDAAEGDGRASDGDRAAQGAGLAKGASDAAEGDVAFPLAGAHGLGVLALAAIGAGGLGIWLRFPGRNA